MIQLTSHGVNRNFSKPKEIHCKICYHSRSINATTPAYKFGELPRTINIPSMPLGSNKQFKRKRRKSVNSSGEEKFLLKLSESRLSPELVRMAIALEVSRGLPLLCSCAGDGKLSSDGSKH